MSEYPSGYSSQTSGRQASQLNQPFTSGLFTPQHSQANPAKWCHRQFIECLFDFEKRLDEEHELGARLLAPVSDITLRILDVRYYDPNLIAIMGTDESGEMIQLTQHVSQLSVLFVALKKNAVVPIRIGFKLKHADEQGSCR